ncbi:MAG: MazG family protein [Firmicutes bacterium]|nr:MazG family protein [Bacillota bacterium]
MKHKQKYTMNDLLEIMHILAAKDGCPWDSVQTHSSLRKYLIEESYEVAEAIDENNSENLKEELGDVLFQVIFHSEIASKEGNFDFSEVVDGLSRKMIYRHPHIFGNEDDKNLQLRWDELKRQEKGYHTLSEDIAKVPKAFPSLMKAQKISNKVLKKKLSDISDEDKKKEKENTIFNELIAEINAEISSLKDIREEDENKKMEKIGKILIKITDISFFLQINADFSLTNTLETFINNIKGNESEAQMLE